MDLITFEKFIEEFSKEKDFTGGICEEKIELIEEKLNLVLPESYKWFLKKYGSGGIFSIDILGYDFAGASVVEITKDYRKFYGLTDGIVVIVDVDAFGNRINAKISTALVPDWKNTRQYEAVIEIPKGQVLNIGRVEKQYTKTGALLEGDWDQILLPQGWPSEWIKETREVPSR